MKLSILTSIAGGLLSLKRQCDQPPGEDRAADPKRMLPKSFARGGLCALSVHGFCNAHHAGHAGDNHAQDGLNADGAAVIPKGIEQRAFVARFRSGIREKHYAGNHRAGIARKARNAHAKRQALREQGRKAIAGEGDEVIQHELHGMHNPGTLDDLQKAV